MPDTGAGTITPIPVPVPPGAVPAHPGLASVVPSMGDLRCDELAVSLPMYAQAIQYNECAFFGVINSPNQPNDALWPKESRNMIAHFLAEAQAEIEEVCRYPLVPRWFADEEHDYGDPLATIWNKVIEAGVEATAYIDADSAISYVQEPATVGPIATTVTDAEEVRVYHPDTCARIWPSNIDITGGQLTIEIPRCRLLTEAGQNEPAGVDYEDTGALAGFFLQVVDVVRVYNDPATNATLVWSHGTGCCSDCAGAEADACITVLNGEIGKMDILPASYNGSWSTTSLSCLCCVPDRVKVNYRAGMTTLTQRARDAVIRLAHAKMPYDPCNIDPPFWAWQRDRNVPRALTSQRINCPYGLEDGAWAAYKFARAMRVVRGFSL